MEARGDQSLAQGPGSAGSRLRRWDLDQGNGRLVAPWSECDFDETVRRHGMIMMQGHGAIAFRQVRTGRRGRAEPPGPLQRRPAL